MNRQYNALRGVAILLVVINHTIHMGTTIPQELGYPTVTGWAFYLFLVFTSLGVFAVPTFLFISGCFFAYVAQGKDSHLSIKTILTGLKHILWPYLIWSVMFYLVIYLGQDKTYTITGYIKNIVVGYPYNFVPLIIFFYILSPLLVYFGKRFGWLVIGVIALYQIMLINQTNPGIMGLILPNWLRLLAPPVIKGTIASWGIYFPLGVVYSLNAINISPWLKKFKWLLVLLTTMMFSFTALHNTAVINFPLAEYICPLSFVLLLPFIKRESIPFVKQLEKVGKKSYGLYLTNLIVLYITILVIYWVTPQVLHYIALFQPFLFIIALMIPLITMSSLERIPTRGAYRYVFG